jgi:hypothetical protein
MKRVLLAVLLSFVFFSSSAMASMIGQCNALLGKFFGASHQVVNGIDVGPNCDALSGRINDFVDAGCVPLLDSGQLFIAHMRPDLPLPQALCGALVCDCAFVIPECDGVVSCGSPSGAFVE